MSFAVAVSDDTPPVLRLTGDLDLAAADEVRAQGFAAVDATDGSAVHADLAGVGFLDSTALGALVEVHAYAEDAGRSVVLRHVPDQVRSVIAMAGLESIFRFATG